MAPVRASSETPMGSRAAVWVAGILWVVCAAMIVCGLLLLGASRGVPLPPEANPWGAKVVDLATLIVYPTLAALILIRRPGNAVGWLFCAASLAGVFTSFADAYAVYALHAQPSSPPTGEVMAWAAGVSWRAGVGLAPFLLLLFPDGRLPSCRWRPVGYVLAANYLATVLVTALAPGPVYESLAPENPFAVGGAAGEALRVLDAVSGWSLLAALVVAVYAALRRFRRSSGDERQQLKWVAGAIALLTAVLISTSLLDASRSFESLVEFPAFLAPPVAAAVAMLRHHLYDVDVLINRTLVYGIVTISLAAIYFTAVALFQGILRSSTGHGSTLAVVASTLAIAALFRPLRSRTQGFVDRRFYRSKYDADKTLRAFSDRLRAGIDLDALSDELLNAARDTVQPEHASLWLRPPNARMDRRLSGENRRK